MAEGDGLGSSGPVRGSSGVSHRVALFLSWILQRVVFFLEPIGASRARRAPGRTAGGKEREAVEAEKQLLGRASWRIRWRVEGPEAPHSDAGASAGVHGGFGPRGGGFAGDRRLPRRQGVCATVDPDQPDKNSASSCCWGSSSTGTSHRFHQGLRGAQV